MAQYLLAVFHAPGVQDSAHGNYASSEEADAAYARVGAFNQRLMDEAALVFACGLTDPNTALTVEATGSPRSVQAPLPRADVHLSGFWVVEAEDLAAAEQLALAASEACGQRVEVRQLQV